MKVEEKKLSLRNKISTQEKLNLTKIVHLEIN